MQSCCHLPVTATLPRLQPDDETKQQNDPALHARQQQRAGTVSGFVPNQTLVCRVTERQENGLRASAAHRVTSFQPALFAARRSASGAADGLWRAEPGAHGAGSGVRPEPRAVAAKASELPVRGRPAAPALRAQPGAAAAPPPRGPRYRTAAVRCRRCVPGAGGRERGREGAGALGAGTPPGQRPPFPAALPAGSGAAGGGRAEPPPGQGGLSQRWPPRRGRSMGGGGAALPAGRPPPRRLPGHRGGLMG